MSGPRLTHKQVNVAASAGFGFVGSRMTVARPEAAAALPSIIAVSLLFAVTGAFAVILDPAGISSPPPGYAALGPQGGTPSMPASATTSRAGSRISSPEPLAVSSEWPGAPAVLQRMTVVSTTQMTVVFAVLFCSTRNNACLTLALLYAAQAVASHVLLAAVVNAQQSTLPTISPETGKEGNVDAGGAGPAASTLTISDRTISLPTKRLIASLSVAPLLLWLGHELSISINRLRSIPASSAVRGANWVAEADYEL